MIWIDYCILGVVALSIIVGALRGFVRDALGTATWILAFLAAYFLGGAAATALVPHIEVPAVRVVAGYALVFFVTLFLGAIVTHFIGLFVRDGAAGMDRTLGAGFGLLRGLTVAVLVVMLASLSAHENHWYRQSRLIPPLVPLANAMRGLFPERWLDLMRPQSAADGAATAAGE